jgi:hypothetical protein
LELLAQALHDEGYLDLDETFIDGSFAPAKQGGACVVANLWASGASSAASWPDEVGN